MQMIILKCIYFGDGVLFTLNLMFCFYIVIRYVCRSSDFKLGFIYYFYTFAILLSACRLTYVLLMVLEPDEVDFAFSVKETPAKITDTNIMDRICDSLFYVFGCVIVYSIYQIGQKLQMIPM